MSNLHHRLLFAMLLLFLTLGTLTSAFAQITPSQDSYTNTAAATTNYGTAVALGVVSSSTSIQTTYIKFDLSSIPTGYSSTNVAKATLKLYVNSVSRAGSFNVDFVNGSWAEKTVTANLAPALGSSIASSVPLTTARANNYVEIDVTTALGEWLNGSQPNDGIALVANSGLSATFDSKENSTQSHPAELDIVYTGAITGVTAGSGLSGGGTSGNVTLSLLNSCSAKQILQWNGSAWVCTSAATGTITGVAAGTDLTGGGTSGNVTLNLDTTKVPQLNTSNTFTASQTVNGDLTARALFGSNVWVTNASPAATAIAGTASATNGEGWGVYGVTYSNDPGAYGVYGLANTTWGTGAGVYGETNSSSAQGSGVFGLSSSSLGGQGVEGFAGAPLSVGVHGVNVSNSNTGSLFIATNGAGVWGDTATNNFGIAGTADDGSGGYFENNSPSGFFTLWLVADNAGSFPLHAYNSATGKGCDIDNSGNLNCSGAKHAVVPIDSGRRKVALSAIESPVNWFEDAGSAQLVDGAAVVKLDSDFIQTVNTQMDYKVFPVPNGDCKGLYVTNKTAASFEVRELGGGSSNVRFDYRVLAIRKNYENVRFEDHTNDPDPAKFFKARNQVARGSNTKRDMKPLHQKTVPAVHSLAQKPTR
jgi:hypothetical protein